MIKLIENIDTVIADNVKTILESYDFPWFLQKGTTEYGKDTSKVDDNVILNPQFCHNFYKDYQNSALINLVMPILSNVDVGVAKKLIRVKANLNHNITGYRKSNYQPIHTDYITDKNEQVETNYMSLLYYVNDSDGETRFFDKGNVIYSNSPKKGTAVLFNSNIEHAGGNPIDTTYRMVVNFIYKNVFNIDESLIEYKILTENIQHGDGNFYEHNKAVFDILKSLNLNDDICLAGLYHSVYGTEFFNPGIDVSRTFVCNKIGSYAESLVYDFCNLQDRDNAILHGNNRDLQYIAYANLLSQINNDNVELKKLVEQYKTKLGI